MYIFTRLRAFAQSSLSWTVICNCFKISELLKALVAFCLPQPARDKSYFLIKMLSLCTVDNIWQKYVICLLEPATNGVVAVTIVKKKLDLSLISFFLSFLKSWLKKVPIKLRSATGESNAKHTGFTLAVNSTSFLRYRMAISFVMYGLLYWSCVSTCITSTSTVGPSSVVDVSCSPNLTCILWTQFNSIEINRMELH